MNFLDSLKRLLGMRVQNKHKKRRRMGKINKCNAVRFDEGIYASDSGLSDYKIFYKIRSGEVRKRILKLCRRGEDTYQFNYVELTPVTNSAKVVIVKRYLKPGYGKSIWRVLLLKTRDRRPMILKIRG